MSELTEAVRAGATDRALELIGAMTPKERRCAFDELKELRKELRPRRWESDIRRALPALHAAGAVCQTGPAGVAAWLAGSDMRWGQASPDLLLTSLNDRAPEWLAEVARRLAERPATAEVPYELMAGLVRLAGCPAPTTDAYVRGWILDHRWWRAGRSLGGMPELLRQDPDLVPLVSALFETDDIGGWLDWQQPRTPSSWTGALARLTSEGTLDRKLMIDGCASRLLRGGQVSDLRAFLALLRLLEPTREETRERSGDWLALASDAISVVASYAQSVLGELALDGELPPRMLAQMSEAVLFRPEKKLVRAQLVLLGKVLTRHRDTVDELLPVVAQAFGHEDPDIQERALKLAERHLRHTGSAEVREELTLAAEQLIPPLLSRAAGSLGFSLAVEEPVAYEELLPPVPEPARLAPAPVSAAEVAEEINALLASDIEVAAYERALDGLVRHAHEDRDGLLRALEPVVTRRWWYGTTDTGSYFARGHDEVLDFAMGLDLLLAVLHGVVPAKALRAAGLRSAYPRGCPHTTLQRVLAVRIWDLAHRLHSDPLPLLLSTPTWSTGLLDPADLVERLAVCRLADARLSQTDFAVALLRVRRTDRVAALAAAEQASALGTEEGTRLARWLTTEPAVLTPNRREATRRRIVVEYPEFPELQDGFRHDFRLLDRPMDESDHPWWCGHWQPALRQHWTALLPERRELVAARLIRDMANLALENQRGAGMTLPLLAESGGEAGQAMHLCLAFGLGARHPEDRLAAVDALLVLAARGQLDAVRLGTDLGELLDLEAVQPLRLADSLRTAAATGACATTWNVLSHALPTLLGILISDTDKRSRTIARGLGELLTVAAECVERCGAYGELRHLREVTARRGSSRVVTQARRLHTALAGTVPAAT